MAEAGTHQGQQTELPGTPAATTTAPPAPDIAAIRAEAEAHRKAADKATKALADHQKRLEDPEFMRGLLVKHLGLDKTADPAKELETLKAKASTHEQDAVRWKSQAINTALRTAAMGLTLKAGVDPAYADDVVTLLDLSGVEIDEATLRVKDASALTSRIDAFKQSKPLFFQQPAKQAAGAAPAGNTGVPLPRGNSAAAPAPAGSAPGGQTGFTSIVDALKAPIDGLRGLAQANRAART